MSRVRDEFGGEVRRPATRVASRAAEVVGYARAESRRFGRVALAVLLLLLAVPQAVLAQAPPAAVNSAEASSSALSALQLPGVVVIDYPGGFRSSTPLRLRRAGVGVAIRYVGAARWKSLTRSEANALRKNGVDIAAVYETNAGWMLGGRAAGVTAAKKARAAVRACGGPRTPFIYFACDVNTSRYSTVNACLRGAASVLGADHVGIYGSYSVCASALRSGYASKAWQTEAWSGGKLLPQAVLYQRAHHIDGSLALDYDSNSVRADDIGQWGYAAPGSVSWAAQSTPATATLNSVDFADANAGWAVGDGGTVIHTTNGGSTWTAQSTQVTATLTAVRFTDGATGWSVGASGTVLHTGDGGSTWSAQSVPTTATLNSVDFTDADTGWAVGSGGTVVHTANGGSDWTAQSTPTTATLTSVHFTEGTTGWSVGASGTVLHTTDGATWSAQSTPTTATLTSVDFTDSHAGWAVGESGVILRTTNGGSTWSVQASPTTSTLTSVRFTDSNTGWAVGDSGTVLRTTNGGSSWTVQSVPSTATLVSADFTDSRTGWVVGGSGTVLHAAGAGSSPFGTITGIVTDAVSGAPVSGASVQAGSRLAAPTATDGSFVAARLAPGTYGLSFSNARYITGSVGGVLAPAGGRTTIKPKRLAPRTRTTLSSPVIAPSAPQRGQVVTLTVTLSPSSAATSAVTVISGSHYEQKTVKKKIKGKLKKVKVWYWRSRFTLTMATDASGNLVAHAALAPGIWLVQAKFAGSWKFLPATSSTTRIRAN